MALLWFVLLLSLNYATSNVLVNDTSSLADIFDAKKIHAYFLSGGKQDRIDNCYKIMQEFGLEKRHFDFIQGPMNISDNEIVAFQQNGSLSAKFNQSRYKMGIGRFLCQLGKLRVMTAFLASEYEEMILFEDDVNVPSKYNFLEAVEYTRLMLSIPTEVYDMQYLGYCFECFRRAEKIPLNHTLGIATNRTFHYTQVLMPQCNHAVLFKRKAVKAFMQLSKPFKMPGDVALSHAICTTGMIAIRPASPIFMQNRKEYGSFLGHTKDIPAFREKFTKTDHVEGRCFADKNICEKLFDYRKSVLYGFGDRANITSHRVGIPRDKKAKKNLSSIGFNSLRHEIRLEKKIDDASKKNGKKISKESLQTKTELEVINNRSLRTLSYGDHQSEWGVFSMLVGAKKTFF